MLVPSTVAKGSRVPCLPSNAQILNGRFWNALEFSWNSRATPAFHSSFTPAFRLTTEPQGALAPDAADRRSGVLGDAPSSRTRDSPHEPLGIMVLNDAAWALPGGLISWWNGSSQEH